MLKVRLSFLGQPVQVLIILFGLVCGGEVLHYDVLKTRLHEIASWRLMPLRKAQGRTDSLILTISTSFSVENTSKICSLLTKICFSIQAAAFL